jgi:hypothetical protein
LTSSKNAGSEFNGGKNQIDEKPDPGDLTHDLLF